MTDDTDDDDLIGHAVGWQNLAARYHLDAMTIYDIMMRRHQWNRYLLANEWNYMMRQAAACYFQARFCMGLEEEPTQP